LQTHKKCQLWPALILGLFLLIHGAISVGCLHKPVQVSVEEEDVKRANKALMEGDLAFNRKEYYPALLKYLEGVRRNPNNENIYNRLGITYAQLKFYESAEEALRQAIQLNPRFSYAWNNLGSTFFLQKKLKKAEKYLKKAIQLNKQEASFHLNLGNLYLEKKHPREAILEWRMALALDPQALTRGSAVNLTAEGRTSPMERSYLMARLFAAQKNVDLAIENLKLAYENGFSDVAAIEKQQDFDSIRRDPAFENFLKNMTLLIRLRAKVGLPADASPPSIN
jgi:tetratricopeptide (TPR) repeat protein